MSRSSIEWTQATWNPIVGCSIVSPGCTNCYAMKMAARLEAINTEARAAGRKATVPHYDGITRNVNGNNVWTGLLAQSSEKTLLEPLRTRRPTTYFVNSMSDLFHEAVPDEWIDQIFAVMALTPQHTYQVLTKRAKRAREYFAAGRERLHTRWLWAGRNLLSCYAGGQIPGEFPLPNVWLGVSTERQKEADERIPDLLATPAAVRFISAEPLLGPIDLTRIGGFRTGAEISVLDDRMRLNNKPMNLDWVIVGGESGPGSRPMHPDWARSLRNQCLAAGVPFFFKQWGAYLPFDQQTLQFPRGQNILTTGTACSQHSYIKVGKKVAGRLLDGVLHDEMPAAFTGRRATVDQIEGAAS